MERGSVVVVSRLDEQLGGGGRSISVAREIFLRRLREEEGKCATVVSFVVEERDKGFAGGVAPGSKSTVFADVSRDEIGLAVRG